MLNYIQEHGQDFVMWRSQQLVKEIGDDPQRKHEAMKSIARMLSYFDTLQKGIYTEEISKKHKTINKKQLNEVIKEYENDKRELQNSSVPNNALADYEKWGFYVDEHCYFFRSKEEAVKMSNFEMRPVFHVNSINDPRRIYELINYRGHKVVVDLDMQEMTSLQKFQQNVEGIGNFLFWGSIQHFNKLKLKLYEEQRTCFAIENLGWQKEGFYAWSNGIIKEGAFHPIDDFGLVEHNNKNYFIPAFSKIYIEDTSIYIAERRFKYVTRDITLQDWSEKFTKVYGNNGKVGIAFWMATVFRDIFVNRYENFPILSMYGPGGTGKSQLTHSLMSMFGEAQVAANIHNTTKPGLAEHMQQFINAFAWIDEYKNNIDTEKIEFLKSVYDGIGRNRMNIDKGKKKETTKVNSALILSGQDMPTADNALFLRVLFLQFYKNEFSEEESRRYDELKEMTRDGMAHLTSELLKYRKYFQQNIKEVYAKTYKELHDELITMNVKTRIIHNWAVILSAFITLKDKVNIAIEIDDMKAVIKQKVIDQQNQVGKSNEMSQFWNILMATVGTGEVIEGWDFRIDNVSEAKLKHERKTFAGGKRVLSLKFNDVYNRYAKEAIRSGQSRLDASTMKAYLENSPVYLGEFGSRGFKKEEWQAGETVVKRQTTVAMAFDYDLITQMYNVELSQSSMSKNEDKAQDEDVEMDAVLESGGKGKDDDLPF